MSSPNLQLKRLLPTKVTDSEILGIGELLVRSFREDNLMRYIRGPKFENSATGNYNVLLKSIRDPRERLAEYIRTAERYTIFVTTAAKTLHSDLISSGYDTYVLTDKSSNDRPVAMAMWEYPEHMKAALDKELGRTGILWNLYRKWITLKYRFVNLWYLLRGLNPLENRRALAWWNERNEIIETHRKPEEVAKSSDLWNEEYPVSSMGYLKYFVVDPDYHKQGLGSKLINESMEKIPNIPTPFRDVESNSIVEGPQKFFLESSPAGYKLYSKNGWTYAGKTAKWSFLPPEAPSDTPIMYFTR